MSQWLQTIIESPAVRRLAQMIRARTHTAHEPIVARGAVGSSAAIAAAALQSTLQRPLLLVTAHLDEADEAIDEFETLGIDAARLPAMELAPGESGVALDLLAERLMLIRRLIDGKPPSIIVAPMPALMQGVPDAAGLPSMLRVIRVGDRVDQGELVRWMSEAGYGRVETIDSAGEFAIRGGIIDIFPPGGAPSRIDLFGDEVEALREIDLGTMGSDRRINQIEIVGATLDKLQRDEGTVHFAATSAARHCVCARRDDRDHRAGPQLLRSRRRHARHFRTARRLQEPAGQLRWQPRRNQSLQWRHSG